MERKEHGVISLEACIVVPIFIFVMMFFYGFIVLFSGEQMIAHSLIQSAESLSLDPYATEKLDLGNMEYGGDLIQVLYADTFTSQSEYFSSTQKWYAKNNDLMRETVRKRFLGFLAGDSDDVEGKADEVLKTLRIQNGINGLDFSETKIEDGVLTIKIKYTQEFIYNFQGLAAFDRETSVSVTLWN